MTARILVVDDQRANVEILAKVLQARGYDAFEKTIRELQADMAAGATTAVELVRFYLRRIEAFDQAGPRRRTARSLRIWSAPKASRRPISPWQASTSTSPLTPRR